MADDDFAANILTTGRFVINGNTTGNILFAADHDWFKGWLWAGHTYVFQVRGSPTADGTLPDPFINMYNASGIEIPVNTFQNPFLRIVHDGGIGTNAYLRFVPETSGYYFLDACDFALGTGTYRVAVAQQADMLARYDLWGTSINSTGIVLLGDVNNNATDILNPDGSGSFPPIQVREDIVAIASNGDVFVSLNNTDNSGFAAPVLATSGATTSDRLFDINTGVDFGDDLLQIYNGNAFVATSNTTDGLNDFAFWGSGFLPSATIREIGFNTSVDSRSDAIQFSGGAALVALQNNTNNGFNAFTTWATGCTGNELIGDFNRDQGGDLLQIYNGRAYVALTNGTNAFNAFTAWADGVTASDRIGDFNADGRDDLFQVYNGNMYVALSNGTMFGGFTQWGSGAGANTRLADFNGDRRLDVFQVDANGVASVALANTLGTGFTPFESWAINVGQNDRLGMVNGDGLTDVIQLYNGNAYVWESIAVPAV